MATDQSSSIERGKAGRSIVTVTVPQDIATTASRDALARLSQRIAVKGFRPGKAPEEVLKEKIGDETLFEETVRQSLRGILPGIIREHQLRPIIPPRIEAVSRDPLTLKITFIERPPVKVKNQDTLAPKKEPIVTDPKDIERVIQSALAEHRTFAAVERSAQKGDRITIRFSAKEKDGTDIKGLSSESERVIIGEGRLLPGFEDALVGLSTGGEKTFPLTLPEKFPAEHLKGKEVTFTVHVQSVEAVTTPAFDDAFATKHLQQPSAAAFRTMVEESMRTQEEQFRRMSRERALLDAIREHTQAEIPDELLEQELQSLVEEWAGRLEQQGTTVEEALKKQGKTAKQVEEELRTEAKNRWTLRLGISHLIEEKKIALSEADEKAAMSAFLESLPDEERDEAAKRIAAKDALYDEVRWRATVDTLIASLLA